jgi:WD40 repeat protein
LYRGDQAADKVPLPVVAGYEMLGLLGRGGMGVVYKARHLALKRTVALKMILAGGHAGEHERARFRAEAEAVARLQHPGIVQIHEVGEHDGHPFCALEFIDGGSLAQKLDGNSLPAREAARLVEALARAMHLAHSRNVVHRDLKPANVLLTADGTPKVTDFGLARQLDSDSGQTQTGAVMGTPSYMAPEQASGRTHEAGPAADVYALGAILYECLTGQPPFKGATLLETLEQVRTREPVPPSRLQAKMPQDLETICLKCLSKEPEKRYSSAESLAEDLRRYLAGEPIAARPVSSWERARKWAYRHPAVAALWMVGAVTAAALVVVGILYNAQLQEHTTQLQKERNTATAQERLAKEQELWARHRAYDSDMFLAYQNWNNKELGRALARLQLQRPQEGQSDLRGFEWFCLWGLCHGDRGLLRGHQGPVNRVRFAPDGKSIISAGADKSIILWDTDTGQPRQTLRGHTDSVWALALSPDGRYLVSGCSGRYNSSSDKSLNIWDARTGQQLQSLNDIQAVRAASFSPDGKLLAISRNHHKVIELWDVASWKLSKTIAADDYWTGEMAFSPDGRTLVEARYNGTVKLRDLASGKDIATLAHANYAAHSVAFSPDGKTLATGCSDATARLWDAVTFKELALFQLGEVFSLAFSPDGQWLALAGAQLTLLDLTDNARQTSIPGHSGEVNSVAFAADGRSLVTGGADGTVRLWQVPEQVRRSPASRSDVWSLAFSPKGDTLAVGGNAGVKLLDTATWQERAMLPGGVGWAAGLAFAPGGKWLGYIGDDGCSLRIWDLDAGKQQARIDNKEELLAVAFSPDGSLVAAGGLDKTVRLWTVPAGQAVNSLPGHKWFIRSLAFSRDGKTLAVGCGDDWGNVPAEIKLWDVEASKEIAAWEGHASPVKSIAFSPDGRLLASASRDETVKLWNVATQALEGTLEGHTDQVWSLAFSPDGKRLASGGADLTVKLWDLATRQEVASLQGHRRPIGALAFSTKESLLVSAGHDSEGRGELRFWRANPEAAESPAARRDQQPAHGIIPITFPGQRSPSLGVAGSASSIGFQVTGIPSESSVAGTGLRVNDVIFQLAGKKVQSLADMRKVLAARKFGEEVILDVRRGDRQLQIKALLRSE